MASTSASRDGAKRSSVGVLLLLAGGMTVFGSATPVSKLVVEAMPVFVGAALRVALGALLLLPFVLRRRQELRDFARRDWLILTGIAVFGMFAFTALMLYGMRLASGVTGAVVMSTTPAVTALGAMLLLGEAASWRKLLAVALAVAGVLLLQMLGSDEQESEPWLGALLVFGAVCCEACYTLLGRLATREHDPLLIAGLACLISLPLFLPVALVQGWHVDFGRIPIEGWLAVAWYGAGTLALGSALWYSGVARAEGSVAAGFMGLMPVSALLLSYLLLGEPFRWGHLAGFAVVFSGVLLISWEHARPARD